MIVVFQDKIEWVDNASSVEKEDPGRVIIDNEGGIRADNVLITSN